MDSNLVYFILWGLFPIVIFSLLLGYRYFKNKENMALIEKGINLNNKEVNKNSLLIWSSAFIGIAVGFFVGIITLKLFHTKEGFTSFCIVIASIFFFVGLALLVCYSYLKKIGSKKL